MVSLRLCCRLAVGIFVLAWAASAVAEPFAPPAALPVQAEPPPLLRQPWGGAVTKAEWPARAQELRTLLQQYEYGVLPPPPEIPVEATLQRVNSAALQGAAVLKEYELTWGTPTQRLHVLVITPVQVARAPLFLGLSFASYHEAFDDPALAISGEWAYPPRGKDDPAKPELRRGFQAQKWQIPTIISRGYGIALFFPGEIVPDARDFAEVRLQAFRAQGEAPRGLADCGAIGAWAWVTMRVMDFLQTVPEVDPQRVAVVGHSRLGKTALLAGALDPRFKVIIPCQAGCGGTAPSRVAPELSALQPNGRPTVETVARITESFPHWFAGNFAQFAAEPARLPFDQHALLALCAPRPVLVAAAVDDGWANPPGQFAVARLADEVYRLLSGEGLEAQAYPAAAPSFIGSRLGWYLRPGKHEVKAEDWAAFLDYADRWLR